MTNASFTINNHIFVLKVYDDNRVVSGVDDEPNTTMIAKFQMPVQCVNSGRYNDADDKLKMLKDILTDFKVTSVVIDFDNASIYDMSVGFIVLHDWEKSNVDVVIDCDTPTSYIFERVNERITDWSTLDVYHCITEIIVQDFETKINRSSITVNDINNFIHFKK